MAFGETLKPGFKTWKQWESMPCGRIEVWPMRGTTRRVPEMVLNVLFPWSVFRGQSVILTTTFKNLRGEVKSSLLKTQEKFRLHGLEFAQEARANRLNSCAKCLSFGRLHDSD